MATSPAQDSEAEGSVALGRTLALDNRDDLAYIEALADQSPLLSSRDDMPDPLTAWWRDVVVKLIHRIRELEG